MVLSENIYPLTQPSGAVCIAGVPEEVRKTYLDLA
jgi:hypothetical protein